MKGNNTFDEICRGTVFLLDKDVNVEELQWQENPSLKGVAIKHLVYGEHTNGQFSAHLVRVLKGCEISTHTHEGKWEMHEVISGAGHLMLKDKRYEYQRGTSAVLPNDTEHSVKAAEEDLYILAKFIPALL